MQNASCQCKNIDITIPENLIEDFLGSMVIDILHDTKGRETVNGINLCKITDLVSDLLGKEYREYIFMKCYSYLFKMWENNKKAFGVYDYSNNNYTYLRKHVLIPITPESDTFYSLGIYKKSVESENYMYQRDKLSKTVTFESPNSVNDFYTKSRFFVDQVLGGQKRLVSLDMKSAAGLIRSTTDPIGYVSSIATYSDPGYNMAGMSAIRNQSFLNFIERDNNIFSYNINLEIKGNILPFFSAEYFWGETDKKDMREYVMIKILDSFFHRSLPKAREMSEMLEKYIKDEHEKIIIDSREKLTEIYNNMFHNVYKNPYDKLYSDLHKGLDITNDLKKITDFDIVELKRWCGDDILRYVYIISSLKLYNDFGIAFNYIFPEDVIENIDIKNLAYAQHHMDLIHQFISQPGDKTYQENLSTLFKTKRCGKYKLINVIKYKLNEMYTRFKTVLDSHNCCELLIKIINGGTVSFPEDLSLVLRENMDYFIPGVNNLTLSFLNLCDRFAIYPEYDIEISEDYSFNALRYILGKFSGDFGQTVWCMATGNVFATEDNNSSAIACIMHRINKKYINGLSEKGWVSIHGMGDGGKVEANFS